MVDAFVSKKYGAFSLWAACGSAMVLAFPSDRLKFLLVSLVAGGVYGLVYALESQ
jgi:hypothetical protein